MTDLGAPPTRALMLKTGDRTVASSMVLAFALVSSAALIVGAVSLGHSLADKTDERITLMDQYNRAFQAWQLGDEATWKAAVALSTCNASNTRAHSSTSTQGRPTCAHAHRREISPACRADATFDIPALRTSAQGRDNIWRNVRQNGVAVWFTPQSLNDPLPYQLTFDSFKFDVTDQNAKRVVSSMKAVVTNAAASNPPVFALPANGTRRPDGPWPACAMDDPAKSAFERLPLRVAGQVLQMSSWTVIFNADNLVTSFFQDVTYRYREPTAQESYGSLMNRYNQAFQAWQLGDEATWKAAVALSTCNASNTRAHSSTSTQGRPTCAHAHRREISPACRADATFDIPALRTSAQGRDNIWRNVRQNGVAVWFTPQSLNDPLPYQLTFDSFKFDVTDQNAKRVVSSMKAVVTNASASNPPVFALPANGASL